MAITTYTSFVGTLAALNVTAVSTRYAYPPQVINEDDLPIQYVRNPYGSEDSMTIQTAGGWPHIVCEIVIVTSPYMLDVSAADFAEMLTIMDNLSTALRGTQPAKSPTTWEIRSEGVQIGMTFYWAVIATVRGNG